MPQNNLQDLTSAINSALSGGQSNSLTSAAGGPDGDLDSSVRQYLAQAAQDWSRDLRSTPPSGGNGSGSSGTSPENRNVRSGLANISSASSAIGDFNRALNRGGQSALQEFNRFAQSMTRASDGMIRHGQRLTSASQASGGGAGGGTGLQSRRSMDQAALGQDYESMARRIRSNVARASAQVNRAPSDRAGRATQYQALMTMRTEMSSLIGGMRDSVDVSRRLLGPGNRAGQGGFNNQSNQGQGGSNGIGSGRQRGGTTPDAHKWTRQVANTVDNVLATAMSPMIEHYISRPIQTSMAASEVMPGFLPSAALIEKPFKLMSGYMMQMGDDVQNLEMEKKSLLSITGSPNTSQRMIEHAVEIAKTDPVEFSTALSAFRSFSVFPGTGEAVKTDSGFRRDLLDVIQRMTILVPEQGEAGATYALRELLSGQEMSLRRRFNINLSTITAAAGKSNMSKADFMGLSGRDMIGVLGDAMKNITGQSAMVERSLTTTIQTNDIRDTLMQSLALPFTAAGAGISILSDKEQSEYSDTLVNRNKRIFGASMTGEEAKERSVREADIAATSRVGAMASGLRGFNDLIGNAMNQTGMGDNISSIINDNIVRPFLDMSRGDTTSSPMDKLTMGIEKVSNGLINAANDLAKDSNIQKLTDTLSKTAVTTAAKLITPAATKGMVMGVTSVADTVLSPDLLSSVIRDTMSVGTGSMISPASGIMAAGMGYAGLGIAGSIARRATGASRFEYDEDARRVQGFDRRNRPMELSRRGRMLPGMLGADFQRGINLPVAALGAGLFMGGVSGMGDSSGALESATSALSAIAGGSMLMSSVPDSMRQGYQNMMQPSRDRLTSARTRVLARRRMGMGGGLSAIRDRANIGMAWGRVNALPIAAGAVGAGVLANEWMKDRERLQSEEDDIRQRVAASSVSATEKKRMLQSSKTGMMGSTASHAGMGMMGLGGLMIASGIGLPIGLSMMAAGGVSSVVGGSMQGKAKDQQRRDMVSLSMIDSYERQKRESGRVWTDLRTEGQSAKLAQVMGRRITGSPEARERVRELDTMPIWEQAVLSQEEKEKASKNMVFKDDIGAGATRSWDRAIDLERQVRLLQQGGDYSVSRESPGSEGADKFGWKTEGQEGWLGLGTQTMDLRRKIANTGLSSLDDSEKLAALTQFASVGQYDKDGEEGFNRSVLEKLQYGEADKSEKAWLVNNFGKFDVANKYKKRTGANIGDITKDMNLGLGDYQESFRNALSNQASSRIAGLNPALRDDVMALSLSREADGTTNAAYDERKAEFLEKAEIAGVKIDSSRVDKFTESIYKMSKGLVSASGGTKLMTDATKQVTEATLKASTDLKDQRRAQMIELMPKFAAMSSRELIPGGGDGGGRFFGVNKNTEKLTSETFGLDATKFMNSPGGYLNRLRNVGKDIGAYVSERDEKITNTGGIIGSFRGEGGRFRSDWETEGEYQFKRQSLKAQASLGRTGAAEQLQMDDDLNKYLSGIDDPDELWSGIQKFGGAGFSVDPELRKRALSGMMSQGLTGDMKSGTDIMDDARAQSHIKMGKELGLDKMIFEPVQYEDADTALVKTPGGGDTLRRISMVGANAPEITDKQSEEIARLTGKYRETGNISDFMTGVGELKDPLAGDIASSLTGGKINEEYERIKKQLMDPAGLQTFADSDQAKNMSLADKEKLTQLYHHTGMEKFISMQDAAGVKSGLKIDGSLDRKGDFLSTGRVYKDKKTGKIRDDLNIDQTMIDEGWWEGKGEDWVTSALPESILTDRSGRDRSDLETGHWRNWNKAIRSDMKGVSEEDLTAGDINWTSDGESVNYDAKTGKWSNKKIEQGEAPTDEADNSVTQQAADTTAELTTNVQTVNDSLGILNESISEAAGRLAGLGL